MCGRYTLTADARQIAEIFDAEPCDELPQRFDRYNLAPQQQAPIIRVGREGRALRLARWGFIPAWAQDPRQLKATPINARADRVSTSPMFRAAFHRQRCLVPATGFYEWQQRDKPRGKQPYYLRPDDGSIFAFAGLWDRWTSETGDSLDTFTILTTEPNDLLKPLHDRMPVILPAQNWPQWLDPENRDAGELTALLKPLPPERWQAVPIGRYVNSPTNDDPACIAPADENRRDAKEPQQPGLF